MAKRTVKSPAKSVELKPEGTLLARSASAAPTVLFPITTLDGVLGQTTAKNTLESAMAAGRLHHAFVFHGPQGVGKLTTAVAFAATILDPTTGPDLSGRLAPQEGSQTQTLARAGTHPDLRIVTKELAAVSSDDRTRSGKQITLAIKVVQEFVVEPAAKARVMPGTSIASRVFIIDEAELMDQRTQNVLLKIMEEPPPGCVIILVTSSEDRILPTIRSRSQRVAFTTLDDTQMAHWLAGYEKKSAVEVPAEHRSWILRFAAGSPGLAQAAIESNLYSWHEALGPLFNQAAMGSFPPELGSTMAKLIGERAEAVVKANAEASKDAANKAWARRMLAYVAQDVRIRLREIAAKSAPGTASPALARALQSIEAISAAEGHLAANVNIGLLFENLAAQMTREPAPV